VRIIDKKSIKLLKNAPRFALAILSVPLPDGAVNPKTTFPAEHETVKMM